jgi:hypothetical protein
MSSSDAGALERKGSGARRRGSARRRSGRLAEQAAAEAGGAKVAAACRPARTAPLPLLCHCRATQRRHAWT